MRTAGSRDNENRPAVANPVRDCRGEDLHVKTGNSGNNKFPLDRRSYDGLK